MACLHLTRLALACLSLASGPAVAQGDIVLRELERREGEIAAEVRRDDRRQDERRQDERRQDERRDQSRRDENRARDRRDLERRELERRADESREP